MRPDREKSESAVSRTALEPLLRVLVAPDSFKGSLDASQAAARMAAGIRQVIPNCVVTEAPIADGGEGTASAVSTALGGAWQTVEVTDANGELIDLPFSVCHSAELGEFAIFDVAEAIGLPKAKRPPGRRTTRGVGQAVRTIVELGYRTIIVGLGGSSTNDGGAGMLDALAFQFVDRAGRPLDPVFDNLPEIHAITRRQEWNRFGNVRIIGLSDVSSPLCGPDGASQVFGPQKGFENTGYADRILCSYGEKFETLLGVDLSTAPGAGAAGGLGFAIAALGGELRQGGMFILDALGLRRDTSRFDWIITGEGRSDRQTLLGKGPALVARLARRHGVPVTLLSGAVEYDPALEAAFDGCMSMQSGPISLAHAMVNAGPLLEAAGRQLAAMFIGARRAARQPASAA